MCVAPAAMAFVTASAGNVFETATSVTSSRLRPAFRHAASIRAFTTAKFARICSDVSTASFSPPAVGAIDGDVRQPVGLLVAGAQRVADREAAEGARQRLCPLEQREQGPGLPA